MPSLNDVVREHTTLSEADLEWLHALVADWHLIADLSFADLVLWVPTSDGAGFRAGAQVRPTTGSTAFPEDLVGRFEPRGRRALLDEAFETGRVFREGDPEWRDDIPVRWETIPVRRADRVLAVVTRNTNLAAVRTPSRLELTYLDSAGLLATMVAEGRFPQRGTDMGRRGAPRVGDGLIRLDERGIVRYASPNALSAYRRLGLAADLVGEHLGEITSRVALPIGPVDEAVSRVVSGRSHRLTEIEGQGATVVLRAIPLDPAGVRVGALVLLRDVTELRRRERELLTKDATIREIHHRVKNNLQTVAALLRLQARRLPEDAGRPALEEAERRVGSIAVVHEILSHTVDGSADFDEVADRLLESIVQMGAGEAPVRASREGSFGYVPGELATPLAMALTEVLQNAVEHGLAGEPGTITLTARRERSRVVAQVRDDGRGLPAGFDPLSGRLGLQIVHTLICGELAGRLAFESGAAPGLGDGSAEGDGSGETGPGAADHPGVRESAAPRAQRRGTTVTVEIPLRPASGD